LTCCFDVCLVFSSETFNEANAASQDFSGLSAASGADSPDQRCANGRPIRNHKRPNRFIDDSDDERRKKSNIPAPPSVSNALVDNMTAKLKTAASPKSKGSYHGTFFR